MSKYEIQQRVEDVSCVSYEQSCQAIQLSDPSMLERVGGIPGFKRLSELFYDRVFADEQHPWFRSIFASSTKEEAIENQYTYLVQTFGGPKLYSEQRKKGKYVRLVGRHAAYPIGTDAAERWMHHMTLALHEHPVLCQDREDQEVLLLFFRYTAYYIVVASEFMRTDQVRLYIHDICYPKYSNCVTLTRYCS
jgi:truncated hemoglobin YjbI